MRRRGDEEEREEREEKKEGGKNAEPKQRQRAKAAAAAAGAAASRSGSGQALAGTGPFQVMQSDGMEWVGHAWPILQPDEGGGDGAEGGVTDRSRTIPPPATSRRYSNGQGSACSRPKRCRSRSCATVATTATTSRKRRPPWSGIGGSVRRQSLPLAWAEGRERRAPWG